MNEVRTNEFGFRIAAGQSGPIPPGEGTILFLGDSQTTAVQVPAESTYVSLIERELVRKGWAVKTMNAGSNGFNTVQEYLFFRKLYRQGFRPRIVVMYVTNNDLFEDVPELPYGRYTVGPDGYLVPLPPDPARLDLLRRAKETPPPKPNFWLRNSAILRHVWYSYRILRTPRDVGGWVKNTYLRDDLDPLARQRWELATAAIRSLNHLVSSYGGTLVIAVHPDPIEWSDAYYAKVIAALPELSGRVDRMKLQRGYRRIAEKLGVQFIDMLQEFPSISVREFRFALDPHANPSGHRVIASQLMKGLERIGVLGRPSDSG
ncbi:MAG: hypothetical protein HYY65_09480 [Candidatus Tectomicrobia bacterium]|uniref:SGNH hydrolase-type esterase domain-containing protein n=1 Tax=Tectimicrobiota bacterium TaxID=2528274 RepID=A0A932GQE8_UNCTE|nr:hypothetical protein [Candidatus Tectomicrobia bacterium]